MPFSISLVQNKTEEQGKNEEINIYDKASENKILELYRQYIEVWI